MLSRRGGTLQPAPQLLSELFEFDRLRGKLRSLPVESVPALSRAREPSPRLQGCYPNLLFGASKRGDQGHFLRQD